MKLLFVIMTLFSFVALGKSGVENPKRSPNSLKNEVSAHVADKGWIKIEGPIAKEMYEKLQVKTIYGEEAELTFKYGQNYRCQTDFKSYYGCDVWLENVAAGSTAIIKPK